MKKCYVYVIQAGEGKDAPVKIGMSDDYISRLKTLQTGNHKKLKVITVIECESRDRAFSVEKTLHSLLEARNVRGEWFKVKQSSFTGALNALANNKDVACVELSDEVQVSNDRSILRTERRKRKNLARQNSEMEIKLQKRKVEAGIMRSKLIELGFDGDINELIGR